MLDYNKFANGGLLEDRLVPAGFIEDILTKKSEVQEILANDFSQSFIIKISKGYTAAEVEIIKAIFYDIRDKVKIQEE